MSKDDRALLFTLGSVLNEFGFLFRIWIEVHCTPKEGEGGVVAVGYELTLLRMFVGKLFEAIERLSDYPAFEVTMQSDDQLAEDWSKVKEWAKPNQPYVIVRNNYAFHIQSKKVASQALAELPIGDLYMLVGEARLNFFSQFSEEVLLKGMQKILKEKCGVTDFMAFVDVAMEDCGEFTRLMSVAANKLLIENFGALEMEEVSIKQVAEYPSSGLSPFISLDGKV